MWSFGHVRWRRNDDGVFEAPVAMNIVCWRKKPFLACGHIGDISPSSMTELCQTSKRRLPSFSMKVYPYLNGQHAEHIIFLDRKHGEKGTGANRRSSLCKAIAQQAQIVVVSFVDKLGCNLVS